MNTEKQQAKEDQPKKRKVTSGLLRDKARTKARMVAAVGKVLQKKGYQGLSAPNVAREAGVDKKLVWTYFGGLDPLVETYISQRDFWKTASKNIIKELLESSTPVGKEDIYLLLKYQFDTLLKDKHLQKIIHWELAGENTILRKIADQREEIGEKLFEVIEPDFRDSTIKLRATLALLIGGIYYLSLHAKSNGSTFCGIDINQEKGKNEVDEAIHNIITCLYDQAGFK